MKKTGRSDADGAVSSVAGCIRETVRRHRLMSLLLAAAIAGSVVLSLLPPLVLERIIDSLAEGKPIAFSAAAGYFLITAVSGLLDAGKETMITVFGQKATHQIRSAMSSKLRRLPSVYFIEKDPGVTVSRFVNDVNTIDSLFASGVISMAADVCRLAGILLVIFTRSLGLGILLAAVTPLLFRMTRVFQKRMLQAQMDGRAAVGRTSQQIPETLQNLRTIRTLRQENFMQKRYGDTIEEGFRAQERSNFYDAVYSPIIVTVSAILVGIVMAASARGGMWQTFFGMSAGTAAAMISYVGSFFGPLESIGMEIQNIQSAVAGVRRINEFLGEDERKMAETDGDTDFAENETGTHAAVSLRDICFRYKEEEPEILEDFSLEVQEGESVILAGRTGSGKSTVLRLIEGLYAPQSGTVRIFGKAPEEIPEEEKRRWMGCVEQQFHRIPGTVGEQVSMGDPQISRSQVEKALQTVGLWETVDQLPMGMDTPCTEKLFSQGQFQLLSIARAIAEDPKLLLLDEMTASLDAGTEEQVLAALEAAADRRTVISVSHRLNDMAMKKKARILVLQGEDEAE